MVVPWGFQHDLHSPVNSRKVQNHSALHVFVIALLSRATLVAAQPQPRVKRTRQSSPEDQEEEFQGEEEFDTLNPKYFVN